MTERRACITGTGSYLPDRILTNHELSTIVDTSDDWIRTRSGIAQRHIAGPSEHTSDMAAKAALQALEMAHLSPDSIDMILVATTTPDQTFPSVATKVQALIAADHAAACDVQAVCSGFIYALSIAHNFILTGQANHVLVIGAEKMSAILDWSDRSTCVLFGDGAGAVVLSARSTGKSCGILSTHLASDGRYRDILYTDEGLASESKQIGSIRMNGQEVFKHAANKMAASIHTTLTANHLTVHDITWIVPHQANSRILDMLAKKLGIASERVIQYVAEHANTSAASIPLALDAANRAHRFSSGDTILLTAIGGGLTWGSCALRW